MEKIVGLLLLIYGILGIAGTVYAYIRAQAPLGEFRALLAGIGQTLESLSTAAQRVGPDIQKRGSQLLTAIEQELSAIAAQLEGGAGSLGRIGETLDVIAQVFDVFTVPDGLSTKPIKILDLKIELPTGLRFGEPLKPVAEDLQAVARQVSGVERNIETLRRSVEVGEALIPQDAKPFLGDVSVFIEQGGHDLEAARQRVLAVSRSPVLSLVPLVVLAYLGLIHVAFSLTGLAFML